MNDAKAVYPGLDFFKLIAALMVVMIHTHPFSTFGDIGKYIGRALPILGVPFFFCCSGFFLSNSLKSVRFPWKKIKKLLIFNLIWTLIYLPFYEYDRVKTNGVMALFFDFFILGTFYHLWYIPALIIDIVIISLIRNKKVLLIIVIPSFLFGVLGNSYYNIGIDIPIIRDLIYDFKPFDRFVRIFSIGLTFTVVGYIIEQKKNIIKSLAISQINILLVVSVVLFMLEIIFVFHFKLQRDIFLTLFLLPLTISFFLKGLYLQVEDTVVRRKQAINCRLIANCIYFIHPLVIIFIPLIEYSILRFFCVYVISALIGYIIIKINNPILNRLIQ